MLDLAPRLLAPDPSPRTIRSLPHRPAFADTLTWLDVHAEAPDAVEMWRQLHRQRAAHPQAASEPHAAPGAPGPALGDDPAGIRRRRRRRRRRRGRGGRGPQAGPGSGSGPA
jgi:hypothetical protein